MYREASAGPDAQSRQKAAGWAMRSESEQKIRSMRRLARSEPEVCVGADVFDRHAWMFNVENGTIDLQTGELRDHARPDYITQLAGVAYDPAAQAPRFGQFLREVFDGDDELISFVQRAAGHSLSGDVSEEVVYIFAGSGANGKSTFLRLMLDLFGDYGRQMEPDLLLVKRSPSHPTGIADLAGARFVVASEIEQGRALDEAKLKGLTGADRIKARRMRQDFFEFDPCHHLFFATNHLPRIVGTDHGIWRRIRVIPFARRFDTATEPSLHKALRSELPGVLAWAVRGCLQWRAMRLATPGSVEAATADYRKEVDHVWRFVLETCQVVSGATVLAKELYDFYRLWCSGWGQQPWTETALGRHLSALGFPTDRGGPNRATRRLGLQLAPHRQGLT